VRTLGALSSLDPKDVGLENFGSHKPYFPRQIKSLSKVTLAQAAVKDVDSGEPVGEIPGWRALIAWYERNLPDERTTGVRIVHGDYKLDNLIFHPTENRVIGILDWELCTLGSPVSARVVTPLVSHAELTTRVALALITASGPGKFDATLGR
jgi:aminoglycoside phosphotransferase (APT) family kinase protein